MIARVSLPGAADEPLQEDAAQRLSRRSKALIADASLDTPVVAPIRRRGHFETLDAFRGLAAFGVMLHHFSEAAHSHLAETGFIAVDFFFVLSGFVIAFAYDRRLEQGMNFRAFVRARAVRLYPMVLIAALSAVIVSAISGIGVAHAGWFAGAAMTVCGVLLLPYWGALGPMFGHKTAFPLNNPSWSLSEEMAVNLIYGAVGRRLGVKLTLAVTASSGVAFLLIAVHRHAVSLGWSQGDWPVGLVRCAYSFFYGALISKILAIRPMQSRASNAWALCVGAVLIAILCLPYIHVLSGFLVTFMLIAGFPVIVILGVAIECSGLVAKLANLSGRLSYPLYLLHYPIVAAAGSSAAAHGLKGGALLLVEIACAAGVTGLAWLALLLDEPLRKRLASGARKAS